MKPRLMIAENKSEPEIVEIGAGPTGLIFAITLTEQGKKIPLALVEKYSDYKRKQLLRVDIRNITSPRILHGLEESVRTGIATQKDEHHVLIPIQHFENLLLNIAKTLEIPIIYKQFVTPEQHQHLLEEHEVKEQKDLEEKTKQKFIVGIEQLLTEFPKCKLLIGADGSRSSVRDLITDKEKLTKHDLRNMIEVKYEVRGKARSMHEVELPLTQPLLDGFLCSEHVKYDPVKNRSFITLHFLVDEKTANDPKLVRVNAKNLLPLSSDLPKKLKKAINIWVKARRDKEIVAGSPTLNKTTLSIYSSNTYGKEISHLPILLIGDASCGFPFMNGLNMGVINLNQLAKNTAELWDKITSNDEKAIQLLIEEHARHTQQTFAFGTELVAKANHKITVQKQVVDVMHYSSLVPIAIIQKIQEPEHDIFSAHVPIKFEPLIKYIAESKSERKQIAERLLARLSEAKQDFDLAREALIQAYQENVALERSRKVDAFTTSLTSIVALFGSRKTEPELESKEVIPKKIAASGFKHKLHDIIYEMFLRVNEYEEHYPSVELAKLKHG